MADQKSNKKENDQKPRSQDLRKPPPEERETQKHEIIGLIASIFRKKRKAKDEDESRKTS